MIHENNLKKTGILCFNCKKRSGIDCAGREPDESTLCDPCFQVRLMKERYEQASHLLECLNSDMFNEDRFYEFMEKNND